MNFKNGASSDILPLLRLLPFRLWSSVTRRHALCRNLDAFLTCRASRRHFKAPKARDAESLRNLQSTAQAPFLTARFPFHVYMQTRPAGTSPFNCIRKQMPVCVFSWFFSFFLFFLSRRWRCYRGRNFPCANLTQTIEYTNTQKTPYRYHQ